MYTLSLTDLQIPTIIEDQDYYCFKKELLLWNELTELCVTKRAGYVVMKLPGRAKDVILSNVDQQELLNGRVEGDVVMTGFDILIEELDKLFLQSMEDEAYLALNIFENFRRERGVGMMDYILEFERCYNHVKRFDIILPEYVLSYKLINNADITCSQLDDIRTAVPALGYSEVKDRIKRVVIKEAELEDCSQSEEVRSVRSRSEKKHSSGSSDDDDAVLMNALFKAKESAFPSSKIKKPGKKRRLLKLEPALMLAIFHVCLTIFHIGHSMVMLGGNISQMNCTMP